VANALFSGVLARFLRDWLPSLVRELEESGRETVQIVVWLVGLSSGLIALAAVNPRLLGALSSGARVTLLGLLAAVVALGVVQRVVYLLAETSRRSLWRGLQGYLWAQTDETALPFALLESWDRGQLVERLEKDFDLDYKFLIEYDAPIQKCREIYIGVYERWQKGENEALKQFAELLAAYSGKDRPMEMTIGGQTTRTADLDHIRKSGKAVNRLEFLSTGLYLATAAAFVTALLLLAHGLAGVASVAA
jgi:hypothetical protein